MNIENRFLTKNEMTRSCEPIKNVKRIILCGSNIKNVSSLKYRNYIDNFRFKDETYLSFHYIIDLNGNIIRCIPEEEISWSTNLFDIDSSSISLLILTDEYDNISIDSFNSQVKVIRELCEKYLLDPLEDVILNNGITGRRNPSYYLDNTYKFEKLRKQISENIWNE